MACKPEWVDSKMPESPDGTLAMVALMLHKVERITFYEDDKGTCFVEWFGPKGFKWAEGKTLKETIIKAQEQIL